MQFTKLRLAGFKSFVDPAELIIEAGLTGIVGPNGCGKSNLVEALQWVMGETSARRLRGGDMDDVIFGGTTTRAARNIASVLVQLDNAARRAPLVIQDGALNQADVIEVERKIERGKGSTYRVNGREQRARDVQIMFADAASGAHSTALVGQGRIGWLINAKPSERRALLEEAAGIGGLHGRRHEAALKLDAAAANLTRLADIAQQLDQQIERLRKQARQAERYRRLSDQVRTVESALARRHWQERAEALAAAAARLAEASRMAEASAAALDQAAVLKAARQEGLPRLRIEATQATQAVERLVVRIEGLAAEERRVVQRLREGKQRLYQASQDIGREEQLALDAEAAIQKLASESGDLVARQQEEQAAEAAALAAWTEAAGQSRTAESGLAAASAELAAAEARRQGVARRLAQIAERADRLKRQRAEAAQRVAGLGEADPTLLEEADLAVAEAEAAQEQAQDQAEAAEAARHQAEAMERAARPAVEAAERRLIQVKAEIKALSAVIAGGTARADQPVLDQVTAPPGLEVALGAALGDDLLAGLDPAQPVHWAPPGSEPAQDPPLPADAVPIAQRVTAPAALARRLAQIGLVPDRETGDRLHRTLSPGQRLVTAAGAAWRWDGLVRAAGAPSAAAVRLAQKNRLAGLEQERAEAEAEAATARDRLTGATAARAAAEAADRGARDGLRLTAQRLDRARQARAAVAQREAQARLQRQSALEAEARAAADLDDCEGQRLEAETERQALPDQAEAAARLAATRADRDAARGREEEARRRLDQVRAAAAARTARLAVIEAERRGWQDRASAAGAQARLLTDRRLALMEELDGLARRPEALASERAGLDQRLDQLRLEATDAGTMVRAAEAAALEAERVHQQASERHALTREARVRAEAGVEQARALLDETVMRIRAAWTCGPQDLPEPEPDLAGQSLAELEQRHERLRREREAIGPVNLMAESEMAAMAEEVELNRRESADIAAAIDRLREAIETINQEGRQRLAAAFTAVDAEFRRLFERLFGGGRAHLELIQESDDPLAAGLEIMASPPGKKLQVLSLLSGGERALTALALVFAVFLVNPAPICVLDEVDAPLDDANVERFCQLVREIGQRTGTRFLIITHHRVSMARMDRLYGVTMSEQGVSQLVSVELATAERLRQTA